LAKIGKCQQGSFLIEFPSVVHQGSKLGPKGIQPIGVVIDQKSKIKQLPKSAKIDSNNHKAELTLTLNFPLNIKLDPVVVDYSVFIH
jgi:hypothetical protein